MYIVIPGSDGAKHMIKSDAIIGASEDLDSRGTVITLNVYTRVIVVHTTLTIDELYEKVNIGSFYEPKQIN